MQTPFRDPVTYLNRTVTIVELAWDRNGKPKVRVVGKKKLNDL